jgi:GTP-binding protein Era
VRAGFVAVVGRTNVGKSTLINVLCGDKRTITSHHPHTTRRAIRAVLTGDDFQLILVDTPGVSREHHGLARSLGEVAAVEASEADVSCIVVDAERGIGPLERRFLVKARPNDLVALNKIDRVSRPALLPLLGELSEFSLADYLLVSARTQDGVAELLSALIAAVPEGPLLYPEDTVIDLAEDVFIAELVREQLIAALREEIPHSIECQVLEHDGNEVTVAIYVERESQKPIVIGAQGVVLKGVRRALKVGYTEDLQITLTVKVAKEWQKDPRRLRDFGY